MEAFDVLEDIREALGAASTNIGELSSLDSKGIMMALIQTVLRLPKENAKLIRRKLFRQVFFSRPNASTMVLEGNEDVAFDGLEATSIYIVFGRAVLVNFFRSFEGAMSRIQSPTPDSPQPNTPT